MSIGLNQQLKGNLMKTTNEKMTYRIWKQLDDMPNEDCDCDFTNFGFPIRYEKGRFIKDKKRFELEDGSDLDDDISNYMKIPKKL